MIKEFNENGAYKCIKLNGENKITAKARYKILDKNEFIEFIDFLIYEELKCIREYEVVDDMTDEEILLEFEENFNELFELKKTVLDNESIVFLDVIQNEGIEKYAATKIVNYLKEKYNKIFLYSIEDAISYWEKQEFSLLYLGNYYGFNFNI